MRWLWSFILLNSVVVQVYGLAPWKTSETYEAQETIAIQAAFEKLLIPKTFFDTLETEKNRTETLLRALERNCVQTKDLQEEHWGILLGSLVTHPERGTVVLQMILNSSKEDLTAPLKKKLKLLLHHPDCSVRDKAYFLLVQQDLPGCLEPSEEDKNALKLMFHPIEVQCMQRDSQYVDWGKMVPNERSLFTAHPAQACTGADKNKFFRNWWYQQFVKKEFSLSLITPPLMKEMLIFKDLKYEEKDIDQAVGVLNNNGFESINSLIVAIRMAQKSA